MNDNVKHNLPWDSYNEMVFGKSRGKKISSSSNESGGKMPTQTSLMSVMPETH